jgi:hypothetical protein
MQHWGVNSGHFRPTKAAICSGKLRIRTASVDWLPYMKATLRPSGFQSIPKMPPVLKSVSETGLLQR